MSKSPVEAAGSKSLSSNEGKGFQSKDSRFRNNHKIRRVAAVDIGTNSTHLVIASVVIKTGLRSEILIIKYLVEFAFSINSVIY